ncbi:STAS domain-containing protein [Thiocystis violacea]|uniref:STAS domain-containing protein n=1 Tax=Thiocystis violacea TaxID=13725 RepID=UPI0019060055|nr:STAS domain-containing protein [Thiocystis violacea]MBK1718490.1 hypothetical protein [Thiocystis violacea]
MKPERESTSADDRFVHEGELTIYTATETLARLRAHLAARQACDLDLSGVSEMDSAGLQLLLWVRRVAQASEARFRLVAYSDAVAEVLGLLHLRILFGLDSAHSAEGGSA